MQNFICTINTNHTAKCDKIINLMTLLKHIDVKQLVRPESVCKLIVSIYLLHLRYFEMYKIFL